MICYLLGELSSYFSLKRLTVYRIQIDNGDIIYPDRQDRGIDNIDSIDSSYRQYRQYRWYRQYRQ